MTYFTHQLFFYGGRAIARKSISALRREEIIIAFYDIVAEKGIGKATTRHIAESVGCSLGMLHHYFANKEEIVLAVLDYASVEYDNQRQQEISTFDSVTERLQLLIAWYFDINEFDLKWFRNLTEFRSLALTNHAVAEALKRFFLRGKKLIKILIEEGIETKEFRKQDPDLVSNLILGSLEGVVALWLIDPDSTPLPDIGKEIQRLSLQYLGAAPIE